MKKMHMLKIVVVVLLVSSLFVGSVAFAKSNNYVNKVHLRNDLKFKLNEILLSSYRTYYKNIKITTKYVPNSLVISRDTIAAEFVATINLTLKANNAEDLPFIKGMILCYNNYRNSLTESESDNAVQFLHDWENEINKYIGKPEPTEKALFMIKAKLGVSGNIDSNEIELYIEEPSANNKGTQFYKVPVPLFPSYEKMEINGENAIKSVISSASKFNSYSYYQNSYNRIAARDYARRWTSNAAYNGDCYMDESKWNNAQYPYYSEFRCNDCADYVSQALHAGGIPIDPGQWDRLRDGNGNFPWAWTYVPNLKKYMIYHHYWETSNFTLANAGNVIVIPNYHAMIITLNDTIHRTFSAHTNDRENYPYYSSNGWEFYTVRIPVH